MNPVYRNLYTTRGKRQTCAVTSSTFHARLGRPLPNGRKTAKARSKNVCNAGCCSLPQPCSHLLSPGRQNKLDSTVENQLAPTSSGSLPSTRGAKFAFSLTFFPVLFFFSIFAVPPFGQCKYLASSYSYEYLSRYEFMQAFIGQGLVLGGKPF